MCAPKLCNSKDRPSEVGERACLGTVIMKSTNWMQSEGWAHFPEIQDGDGDGKEAGGAFAPTAYPAEGWVQVGGSSKR